MEEKKAPVVQTTLPPIKKDPLPLLIDAACTGNLTVVNQWIASDPKYIQQIDSAGWSVLHHAAFSCQPEIVARLLAAGANAELKTADQRQMTAYQLAQAGNDARANTIEALRQAEEERAEREREQKRLAAEAESKRLADQAKAMANAFAAEQKRMADAMSAMQQQMESTSATSDKKLARAMSEMKAKHEAAAAEYARAKRELQSQIDAVASELSDLSNTTHPLLLEYSYEQERRREKDFIYSKEKLGKFFDRIQLKLTEFFLVSIHDASRVSLLARWFVWSCVCIDFRM